MCCSLSTKASSPFEKMRCANSFLFRRIIANNSIRCSNSIQTIADGRSVGNTSARRTASFRYPTIHLRLASPSLFRNFDYRPIDFQSRRRRFRVFESKVSVIRSNFRVETVRRDTTGSSTDAPSRFHPPVSKPIARNSETSAPLTRLVRRTSLQILPTYSNFAREHWSCIWSLELRAIATFLLITGGYRER